MRDKLFSFVSLALTSVFLFFVVAGCDKGKTEKSAEQKISQLQSFALPQETNDLDVAVEGVQDKGEIFEISGWAAIKSRDSIDTTKYLVLQSQNKTYVFDTFSLWKRPDVTQAFKINRDDSGFNVFIPKAKIEKGEYRIGLIIKKDKLISFQYFPGRTLRF
ncbi:MAG: hypothetical protein AB1480_00555 [Nitrospirota bacterium]